MPRHSPIQTSFGAGELSERLRGRVDADIYSRGLARCSNFEPTPQGSLRMRCGSIFVRDLGAEGFDDTARFLQFRMADEDDYLLVLGHRMARLYAINGDAVETQFISFSELVTNGDFSSGGTGWTESGSGLVTYTYTDGKAKVSANLPGAWVWRQELTLADPSDLTIRFHAFDFLHVDEAMRVRLGTTLGGSELYLYQGKPTAPVVASITGAPAGPLYLEIVLVRGGIGSPAGFTLDDVSVSVESAASSPDIETPWTSDQVDAVQFVVETGVDRMVMTHPHVRPYVLQRQLSGAWGFAEATFASQPAEWVDDTWPGVCELYQGRLWLSGVPGQSNRLWGSRTGSIFDFTLESTIDGTDTVLPTDAIDVKLASKGAMRWLQSSRTFLMGTDLGEHSMTAQAGALAPNDLQARDESAFGSCAIQAVHAGAMALYVSADRRKVRALAYDLQSSGWDSKDITFIAEHITRELVTELHWARDPNGSVVALLEDGTAAVCTFQPGEQVVAWWRLSCGTIRTVAVSQGPSGSYLWLGVTRGTDFYLERLPMADTGDVVYLDSAVVHAFAPTGTVVTGLDHLEGQTVGIVADGALEPDQVVAGGQVTLARSVAEAVVGLRYTAQAITLPTEGGNPAGTAQGAQRRRPRIVLRLNDSALPLVDGDRAADRTPAVGMGQAEALRTGDVEAWSYGWDARGAVTIEQDVPLRTEILALFGTLQVNEA